MTNSAGTLTYGAGKDPATKSASENFPHTAISPYSFCVTPIEILSNDGEDSVLSRGTGFFWKRNGQSYLVTNFHVVSGKNPFTLDFLGSADFIPRKIRYHISSITVSDGMVSISRHGFTMVLEEKYDSIADKPVEVGGTPIDIFPLPIANGLLFEKDPERTGFRGSESVSAFLNEQNFFPIETTAGDDCFVVGYPLGNYAGFMPPIWKRGTLASEPQIAVHDLPVFLLDTATTPAMSGAPILRRVVTATSRDIETGPVRQWSVYSLIGVYAGRLMARDLDQTQIGYGWYATMIDRVIDAVKVTITKHN